MIRDLSHKPQLALRPMAGLGLLYHGAPALFTMAGFANLAHMLKEVGFPWPELSAALVAGLEVFSGVAIFLGALTVPFSVIAALELLTRVLVIFLLGKGFPSPLPGEPPLPGYETNLLYVSLLLSLAISGAGRPSLDARLWPPKTSSALHYGQKPRANPAPGWFDRRWTEISPIPLRIVVGGGLAFHGYPKLFTAAGHASFVHIMQALGLPAPELLAWIVGVLEFGGGLALFFGAFVHLVAFAIVLELAINIVSGLLHGGFPPPLDPTQPLPSYEQSLLYLSGALALFIGGSGGLSLTRLFSPKPLE